MTASADKARYFLEQSVPELKELERKKIFTPDEISSITRKRSDYEHKINARGSTPNDYTQYAEFEINVDMLRRKRIKRLGVRSTMYTGQRRIFFVFDRATRKFPGDLGLWMQSIEYARRQKANKKLVQTLTNALRLHPAKPELWIFGSSYAADEDGDMIEARSYMQRGLRFCKSSRKMWSEYIRLELAYMAKIHARRQILGVGEHRINDTTTVGQQDAEREIDEDIIRFSVDEQQDALAGLQKESEFDEAALRNLHNTPVMSGAIPIAIFDAGFLHFGQDVRFAHGIFDIITGFAQVPSARGVLEHIFDAIRAADDQSWMFHACNIALTLIGLSAEDPDYPGALRVAFQRISDATFKLDRNSEFTAWCKGWLQSEAKKNTDSALQSVLLSKATSIG